MRFLFWIIGLPLAVVVVVFALSNRQTLTLGFLPFDEVLMVPVYLAVLAPLAGGFLLGFLGGGLSGLKYRRAARIEARRADDLERRLEALKASAASSPPPSEPPAAGNLPIPP